MASKRTTQVRLTRESADALRRLAADLGFVQTRGILAGELGSIAQMLEALARGELELVRSSVRSEAPEGAKKRRKGSETDTK